MRKLTFFLISLLCLQALAHAETNRLYWQVPTSFPDQNDDVGQVVLIDTSYDDISKKLRWYVTFEEVAGKPLPQGFSLVLNGTGKNPLKTSDGLAFFYFDAQNPADLRLVVYGYNFNMNDKDSWKCGTTDSSCPAPDKIISSISTPGFVKDLTFENIAPNFRRLGFTIDATSIQSHVPLYLPPPAVWQGAQFPFPSNADPKYIGIWFHGFTVKAQTPITYGPDGFITFYKSDKEGYLDTKDSILSTANKPICSGLDVRLTSGGTSQPLGASASTTVMVDQVVEVTVTGKNTSLIATDNSLKVDYSGAPPGAVTSPVSGTEAPVDTNKEASFFLTWKAGINDAGKNFTVDVTFTDNVGQSVQCPFEIKVPILPKNEPPICNAGPGYPGLTCTAGKTGTKLSATGSSDPDGDLLTYLWTTDCPNGVIENPSTTTPTIRFDSTGPTGIPVSCFAYLTVRDGVTGVDCSAPISVTNCPKDCGGIINGKRVFDDCGVCGGSNSDKDRCGVCFGNGDTCLNCKSVNVSPDLLSLDQRSKELLDLTKTIAAKSLRIRGIRTSREEKLLALANREYLNAWQAIYQVPQEFVQCVNQQFCVSVSHIASLELFVTTSANQKQIAIEMARIFHRVLRRSGVMRAAARRTAKALEKLATTINQSNFDEAVSIPSSSSACVKP
jgi:hypothetical protein